MIITVVSREDHANNLRLKACLLCYNLHVHLQNNKILALFSRNFALSLICSISAKFRENNGKILRCYILKVF